MTTPARSAQNCADRKHGNTPVANINFVNGTLIAGTTFNPGLEDVLLPGGTITKATASVFEITNNSGGAFNNFKFDLTSSAANFTYNGTTPTAGKIDGITVIAPDATTHIIEVTAAASGFNDQNLADFFNVLKDPDRGVLDALDNVLSSNNAINGSNVADHATALGFDDTVLGNGGNDILSGELFSSTLVGGAGNDVIRVGDHSGYVVAGGNLNGTAAAGETNTLEVRGDFDDRPRPSFDSITNINALHFVDTKPPAAPSVAAADLQIDLRTDQIGNGLVSLSLAINGSAATSPHSENDINIFREFDPTDTHAVNLDLSHWTFTNWNEHRSQVSIQTNFAVALNDSITGTSVADFIETNAGNDTIRGGGGADFLEGDEGNDTFVYGLNEAARGEEVFGDGFTRDNGVDKVVVLADNDFIGTQFFGVDQLVFGGVATATFSQDFINTQEVEFEGTVSLPPQTVAVVGDGHANTLALALQSQGNQPSAIDLSGVTFQSWTKGSDRVTITGTKSHDDISGSTQADIINGNGGSDNLQGNEGADIFLFKAGFGHGVSHIADFSGEDVLELDNSVFTALKDGALGKKAFGFGTHATTNKQHIIFDKETGIVRYDDDGKGGHHAHIITVLDDVSALQHGDILVI